MLGLARDEKEMLEGKEGPARQKVMKLLVKYAEGGTLRLDGVVGGRLLQLRTWRPHEQRRVAQLLRVGRHRKDAVVGDASG